jgi:DNA-binding GntR family transcriptional regulator
MLSQPVKRTLAEEAADSIRAGILDGRLSPGERLGEEALAESLGVSRGPVREALSQLQREGLVIVQRNGRAYVARLSREDLEEVYSLRLALETLAVRQAIHHANPQLLAELQEIVNGMSGIAEGATSEQEAARFDIRFHDLLCRLAGHKRLYACWTDLRPQIHVLLLSRNVADADFRNYGSRSHQAILDAIRNRDEARAVALIQNHVHGSYKRLVNPGQDGPGGNGQGADTRAPAE